MDKLENILEQFNDLDTERTFNDYDSNKSGVFAIFAYLLPILFFLPYVSDNNSAYCKFHSNQSFIWLLTVIVVGILCSILGLVPIIGFIAKRIFFPLFVLAVDLAFVVGSLKGKAYRLPFVGSLINIF
ncbi:MAG: hypothetical protein K5898_06135 [Ruminococcus sp.]|uniref:DUF4870 domain-containing protein n=1 Tax=Ruminococcus sp. TaxID=41978 RepID=UPI0025D4F349|nr:DUF4870 domain-containing protein [Ruminococcus sp.]MCR4794735.1 hypothetical protein [Ruminococcus sp.]